MKFFLPDALDLVDPSFDFERERRDRTRHRVRDDVYAHEVFATPAFDGLLVSMGIVEGYGGRPGYYSLSQKHHLLRAGAPRFFRVDRAPSPITFMGDCGAFTYAKEEEPPYTIRQVLDFYADCGFDYGVSLDHVILDFKPAADSPNSGVTVAESVRARQYLTLELARKFLDEHRAGGYDFEPLGAAQGWSPKSYAYAVEQLQAMGYSYIALGGMVPLKTQEIRLCLEAIQEVRKPSTRLHLLGVMRTEHLASFERLGVASIDSTSPLRQAFKDEHDNYYARDFRYTAIRIPQTEGNAALRKLIAAGRVTQEKARALENACLEGMRLHEVGQRSAAQVVDTLLEYERLFAPGAKKDHGAAYLRTLTDAPWRNCPCEVCRSIGHHVILFRGNERNKRRGFHNIWTLYQQNILPQQEAASRGEGATG